MIAIESATGHLTWEPAGGDGHVAKGLRRLGFETIVSNWVSTLSKQLSEVTDFLRVNRNRAGLLVQTGGGNNPSSSSLRRILTHLVRRHVPPAIDPHSDRQQPALRH